MKSPQKSPPVDPLAIVHYLDAQVARLQEHLPSSAVEPSVVQVHQARVATRRMKAAIEVVGDLLPRRKLKPVLESSRAIRRRLGPIRDADVMAEHLRALPAAARTARARQRLLQAIEVPRACEGLALRGWPDLRRALLKITDATPAVLAEAVHERLDHFARRATALGKSPRESIDIHELRIDGKGLRYALEIAEVGGLRLDASVAAAFKKLQDDLGLWHDFAALAHVAIRLSADEELSLRDGPLQREMLALATRLVARSEAELDRFTRRWAEHRGRLVRSIRGALPLTRDVEPKAPSA